MHTKSIYRSAILVAVTVISVSLCGCHDGPLYALKHVNPYFTLKEWAEDEAIGITDHERRNELLSLTDEITYMSAKDQAYWAGHLHKMVNNDPSPEMRRLAVSAASKLRNKAAVELLEKGLKDDAIKVRMEACRALGQRREPRAAELLASTAGSESDQDVQHAAIAALGGHRTSIAMNSLRMALRDKNPATRDLAIQSLKSVTGKNYGSDPDKWIRAIGAPIREAGSPPTNGAQEQIAERPLTNPSNSF